MTRESVKVGDSPCVCCLSGLRRQVVARGSGQMIGTAMTGGVVEMAVETVEMATRGRERSLRCLESRSSFQDRGKKGDDYYGVTRALHKFKTFVIYIYK